MKKFLALILSILILFSVSYFTLTTVDDFSQQAHRQGASISEEMNISDYMNIPFPPPDEG